MTLAQLINVLYSVVDRVYIGHLQGVSANALTGIGLALPIITIITAFANLFGMGGAPLCSIARGSHEEEKAEKVMGNSCSMLLFTGGLLMGISLIFRKPLLYLFGASSATFPYANAYISIYLCGTVFVMISLGMNQFINSQGFGKIGMLTVMLGAFTNIVLDPIFIFGFHMGVRGAALATVLSQAISAVWAIRFLSGKDTVLRLKKENFRIRKDVMVPCIGLGFAPFIMQSTESILVLCFNSSLLKYGGDLAVGAMTILSSVMQFAMLPLQGLGQGAQPIISYNYGARNEKRVKSAFRLLLKVSLFYSLLLWGLVMLFPRAFAGMFTSDGTLMNFTETALRVYMAALFIFGIQMACQMTFMSIGNAKASILVAVMRKFVLLIPLIYLMPLIFDGDKTKAVYMAEPVADTFAVIFTVVLFARQFKKALAEISR